MCAQLAAYCRKSNDAFDALLALDGTALTSVFERTVRHIPSGNGLPFYLFSYCRLAFAP